MPEPVKLDKNSAGYISIKDGRFSSLKFLDIGVSLKAEWLGLEDIATDALESGNKQKWLDMLDASSVDIFTLYDSGVHVFFTEKEARDWAALGGDKVFEIYKNGTKLGISRSLG